MRTFLNVRILSPEKLVWEGKAHALSSINSQGPFDILPHHANFISLVENQTIKIHTPDGKQEFKFEHAVIYTHNNNVQIYTNM
jgi:F0F1-type ATP synthase epsilon subunit